MKHSYSCIEVKHRACIPWPLSPCPSHPCLLRTLPTCLRKVLGPTVRVFHLLTYSYPFTTASCSNATNATRPSLTHQDQPSTLLPPATINTTRPDQTRQDRSSTLLQPPATNTSSTAHITAFVASSGNAPDPEKTGSNGQVRYFFVGCYYC